MGNRNRSNPDLLRRGTIALPSCAAFALGYILLGYNSLLQATPNKRSAITRSESTIEFVLERRIASQHATHLCLGLRRRFALIGSYVARKFFGIHMLRHFGHRKTLFQKQPSRFFCLLSNACVFCLSFTGLAAIAALYAAMSRKRKTATTHCAVTNFHLIKLLCLAIPQVTQISRKRHKVIGFSGTEHINLDTLQIERNYSMCQLLQTAPVAFL